MLDPDINLIILLGNSSRLFKEYDKPVQLDERRKKTLALLGFESYYSFPNIDSSNNNFRYSPYNGRKRFNITISEGSYELPDINKYIKNKMKDYAHYESTNEPYYIALQLNNNTLRTAMTTGTNYKVDFTSENSIRSTLGFNSQAHSSGYQESENVVNITDKEVL